MRDAHGFTASEIRVLELVKGGASNKAIARDLCLAEATIKLHLKGVLRKLGVSNRTQAAVWAHQNLPSDMAVIPAPADPASCGHWQSIDTAPKDGTQILCVFGETIPDRLDVRAAEYIDGAGAEELGYYQYAKYGGWLVWNSGSDFYVEGIADATHWMPLPQAPVSP
jgi:DNA-binding CsgD family transcriptional regulator